MKYILWVETIFFIFVISKLLTSYRGRWAYILSSALLTILLIDHFISPNLQDPNQKVLEMLSPLARDFNLLRTQDLCRIINELWGALRFALIIICTVLTSGKNYFGRKKLIKIAKRSYLAALGFGAIMGMIPLTTEESISERVSGFIIASLGLANVFGLLGFIQLCWMDSVYRKKTPKMWNYEKHRMGEVITTVELFLRGQGYTLSSAPEEILENQIEMISKKSKVDPEKVLQIIEEGNTK